MSQPQPLGTVYVNPAYQQAKTRLLRKHAAGVVAGDLAVDLLWSKEPSYWQWVTLRHSVAFHECGHTLIRHKVGLPVKEIRILADDSGYCSFEILQTPADPNEGPSDAEQIDSYRHALGAIYFERLQRAVKRLLQRHWHDVRRLAAELLKKSVLYENEFLEILEAVCRFEPATH